MAIHVVVRDQDPLTNLLNRRAFNHKILGLITTRRAVDSHLAVLVAVAGDLLQADPAIASSSTSAQAVPTLAVTAAGEAAIASPIDTREALHTAGRAPRFTALEWRAA